MARQDKIFLKGKIANMIFYEWKGIPCSRMMPEKVNQTVKTKAAATVFGQAARYSKHLRAALGNFLPDPNDKPMMYALNNVLAGWLRNGAGDRQVMAKTITKLKKFEFNPKSNLAGRLKVKPEVDWKKKGIVTIHLPALLPAEQVTAPAYTRTVHCTVKLVSCRLSKGDSKLPVVERSFDFPHNNEQQVAQHIQLPFTLRKGHIMIAAMKLQYTAKGKLVTDPRWLPAGIVGAWVE